MTGLLTAHVDVMSGLSSGLAELVSSREEEFLGLGASLMEFTSRSQSLAQSASALTELCSGEEIAENTSALSNELASLSAIYNSEEARTGLQALERVMGLVSNLDGQVVEFGRIIKSLTMLGISTRIESARLGDQGLGFSTLADDVETLANKIVQDSSSIAEKSKSLGTLLESVRHRTRALSREQDECSDGILSDIDSSLTALNEMMERSRTGASHIAQRSEIVAANVAEVVSSLQFHDIVRQQVEHIEEALDEMILQTRASIERPVVSNESSTGEEVQEEIAPDVEIVSEADEPQPPSGNGNGNGMKDMVGWVADVSELQISQLDNASQRFAAAVGGLRDGLGGISAAAGEIGTDVSDILSAGDRRDGGTVMDRVGASTKAVLEAMETFSKKSAEIANLIGSVTGTVAEMTEFVSNIEEVGSEIELIALNASIKAAHTGEEGKALGVLAQAIQRLSVDARDRTQAVSEVLMEIANASSELERASDTTQKQALIDQYAERQRELMESLNGLSRRLSGAASEVLSLSSALGADMNGLVNSIRLDDEICPGLDSARLALREVVDASRRLVPVSDDEGRPARLKEMLSRYTMEAERLVHESAFGFGGANPVLNHEDEGEVELFDDVELFDEQGDEEPAGEDWDNVELF
ncbi:methyl-accepting chemotaxis protein [Desulfovibrio ferrophilus]|uniref:Methyl-accepting chemotaxis protein n=1 Tax=Desulfovibrio ferrophilus TaxID=241368 RepID=A0A2Z6AWC4_9BACT|nr:methyl-accepting chemotaxis protein [Desulfovibrio ferrophilus]